MPHENTEHIQQNQSETIEEILKKEKLTEIDMRRKVDKIDNKIAGHGHWLSTSYRHCLKCHFSFHLWAAIKTHNHEK